MPKLSTTSRKAIVDALLRHRFSTVVDALADKHAELAHDGAYSQSDADAQLRRAALLQEAANVAYRDARQLMRICE